jgi:hypothetical protein
VIAWKDWGGSDCNAGGRADLTLFVRVPCVFHRQNSLMGFPTVLKLFALAETIHLQAAVAALDE